MREMTLALDFEGTLMSNAISQFARPGLFVFLQSCGTLYERVVIYTSVPEARFRSVATKLIESQEAPEWFAKIPYVRWLGPHKRLHFVSANRNAVILLDDMASVIHPDDRDRWVRVAPFLPPYSCKDRELQKVLAVLAQFRAAP